ncbi:hypothetical protein OG777_27405 [Micromonospora peucetia]|uniref:Uncharacterized protein n=1 Tax=Micromonospora peucetia TaxID=47871 RepID=A0A1C6VY92_9ACTN|nr:hypothetical protein [Micromonospora peucetia]MCX4390627.1 hypothetical protein [Micromonospora peucetia]SCL71295.1 hypothetical protein GA0070608_4602 [Micromonospora peucetia]
MPASIDRIRKHMKVQPTKRDKGLTLTVTVTAYDNGMVEVDGVPINAAPDYDQGHGWLVAAETVTATMVEFRKDTVKRQKQKGA